MRTEYGAEYDYIPIGSLTGDQTYIVVCVVDDDTMYDFKQILRIVHESLAPCRVLSVTRALRLLQTRTELMVFTPNSSFHSSVTYTSSQVFDLIASTIQRLKTEANLC